MNEPDADLNDDITQAVVARSIASLRQSSKPSLARRLIGIFVVSLSLGGAAYWQFQTHGDRVSDSEQMTRQIAFAQIQDVQLPPIPDREAALALAQMQLAQEDRNALEGLLPRPAVAATMNSTFPGSKGLVHLARMMVWDTHSPDGDVVALVSAGFRQEVMLTGMPQSIAIPVDDTLIVQVIGVHDGGGGGITLGVRGAKQDVMMPVMSQDQILSLPIAPSTLPAADAAASPITAGSARPVDSAKSVDVAASGFAASDGKQSKSGKSPDFTGPSKSAEPTQLSNFPKPVSPGKGADSTKAPKSEKPADSAKPANSAKNALARAQ